MIFFASYNILSIIIIGYYQAVRNWLKGQFLIVVKNNPRLAAGVGYETGAVASGSRVVMVLRWVLRHVAALLLAAPLKGIDAAAQPLLLTPPSILDIIEAHREGVELLVDSPTEKANGEVDGDCTHEGHQNGVGVNGHVPIVPRG